MARKTAQNPKGAGRPRKEKNPKAAALVKALSQYGVPEPKICAVYEESGFGSISVPTLRREYRQELENGRAYGDSKLVETAFKIAADGNVTMLIFLLKTRLGYRETNQVEMTSPDGSMSPKEFTIHFIKPGEDVGERK